MTEGGGRGGLSGEPLLRAAGSATRRGDWLLLPLLLLPLLGLARSGEPASAASKGSSGGGGMEVAAAIVFCAAWLACMSSGTFVFSHSFS